ncbi:hypothetical protein pmac_cds_795 [Pandoravirus macleodensis]|uniref:Uncharacterized protein n=1 Tax=Pandoravirus macleodensis TaxID=2107707 RepID=A0A2U7UG52_9VIRU|nr:hypothetical protein pmac_cds_795 [Pandoravirus macleodensis]AVK77483.1 hypothetical protein pmac_cds_795 [Pandoravirus macleodensis]
MLTTPLMSVVFFALLTFLCAGALVAGEMALADASGPAKALGGYAIQIAENENQPFCAGSACNCYNCMTLGCQMSWADFHVACQENGPCTLFNSLMSCMFAIGDSCTLPYGLACGVTATAY